MSQTILGGSRWDNLVNKTYWARVACQSSFALDETDAATYNDFLREKQKNPVAADIAMEASIRKSGVDKALMGHNVRELERAPQNDYLVKSMSATYKKNYPNTGGLRNLLIENNRFSLNSVTPKMTDKFKKIIIKLKTFL